MLVRSGEARGETAQRQTIQTCVCVHLFVPLFVSHKPLWLSAILTYMCTRQ